MDGDLQRFSTMPRIPDCEDGSEWGWGPGPGRFATWPGDELVPDAALVAKFVDHTRVQSQGCIFWVGVQATRHPKLMVIHPNRTGTVAVAWRLVINKEGFWERIPVCRKPYRVLWELFFGTPSEALDHTCLNQACVNVAHLDPVSLAENSRRNRYNREKLVRSGNRNHLLEMRRPGRRVAKSTRAQLARLNEVL